MSNVSDGKNKSKPDHGRKYGKNPSHPLPVWNGILEHCQKMGPAIWEFLWCIDKITREDENGIGWCLGGAPIDTKRIAADLRECPDTAYNNMVRLANEAYIIRKRTPRGYAIGVVNSRKFQAFKSSKNESQQTVDQGAQGDSDKTRNHKPSDSDKNPNHTDQAETEGKGLSLETDSDKTPNQSKSDSGKTPKVIRGFLGSDSDKTPSRRDTTGHNKETLQDTPVVDVSLRDRISPNTPTGNSNHGRSQTETFRPARTIDEYADIYTDLKEKIHNARRSRQYQFAAQLERELRDWEDANRCPRHPSHYFFYGPCLACRSPQTGNTAPVSVSNRIN